MRGASAVGTTCKSGSTQFFLIDGRAESRIQSFDRELNSSCRQENHQAEVLVKGPSEQLIRQSLCTRLCQTMCLCLISVHDGRSGMPLRGYTSTPAFLRNLWERTAWLEFVRGLTAQALPGVRPGITILHGINALSIGELCGQRCCSACSRPEWKLQYISR